MNAAVVIDIDGVLCDNIARQRAQIARGAPVGAPGDLWDGFADGYPTDPPKVEYVALTQNLMATIVLLTCRSVTHRRVTEHWLHEHRVAWDQLIMWDSTTHGYYEHKEAAIKELMAKYDVQLVIEDSVRHAQMFHSLGLPVIVVPDGLRD